MRHFTNAEFFDDRLIGLGSRGKLYPSPIDFDRHPYNTLALLCECVMTQWRRPTIESSSCGDGSPTYRNLKHEFTEPKKTKNKKLKTLSSRDFFRLLLRY